MLMNRRIDWIDATKGLAILLVVIGHTFREAMLETSWICYLMYNIIYSFHMPLFFSLSGYLLNRTRTRNAIKIKDFSFMLQKINTLIKPFINYSILVYVLFYTANLIPFLGQILHNLNLDLIAPVEYFKASFNGNNPYAFHLWYILVLFYMQTLAFVSNRVSLKLKFNFIWLFAIISFVLWNIRMLCAGQMTLIEMSFLRNTIYFSYGMLMYEYNIKIKRNIYVTLSISAWVYNFIFTFFLLNSFAGYDYLYYIFNLIQMISVMIIINNFYRIGQILSNNKYIVFLGKNSFTIYLFHQPVCAFVSGFMYSKLPLTVILICFLTTVISIFLPIAILYISSKSERFSWICNKLFCIKRIQ